MDTLIVFRIGEEHIGIDITRVREVTEMMNLVPVPRAPEYVLGLVNIRGEVLPVLSLRRRLGLAGEDTGHSLIVAEDEGRAAGLRIDALLGTKRIEASKVSRESDLLSTRRERAFFVGVYQTEEKPILILDLSKTLSKEDK